MPTVLAALLTLVALASPAAARIPTPAAEQTRIRGHLLAARDSVTSHDPSRLTPPQLVRRTAALAILDRYIDAGVYPQRSHDGYPGLRPRFIDADGVHCAVGHMIAVSGSPDLSRSINTEHEYAVVPDIRTPGLTEWATAHGFTVAELTAIQPRYGFEDHPARSRETIDQVIARSKDELVLVCAVHTAEDAVTLVEKGDSAGVVTVTTTNKSSFAACFAKHINDRRARSPYDRRSENFERTIGVRLPTPQDLLEKRLARLDVRDGCVPRPGAIPTKVTIELDSASTPRSCG